MLHLTGLKHMVFVYVGGIERLGGDGSQRHGQLAQSTREPQRAMEIRARCSERS